jgi:hypothetical protein
MGTNDTGIWSYAAGDEWAPGELVGYQVEALDGSLGTVDESSVRTSDGYVVVGTRRWNVGRKVLIPAGLLRRADAHHRTVHVDRTRREIRKAPRWSPGTYPDRAHLEALRRYYGE